ncbi:histidine kinase [Microbulbifer echini]|uniref:Histidine kinase n=1 Tax=Microbulbifer echini TaxID=1529067 RepID=A0ABV4NIE4_9GAMM
MLSKTIQLTFITLLLSACSGGGSGSSNNDTTAEETPPVADAPSTGGDTPPETGDPSTGDDTPATPAQAKDLTLSFEAIKIFRFDWTDAEGASHYHLLENPDGVSGFSPVAENIPQGTETQALEIEAALYNRTNAQYMLQTCTIEESEEQCIDSEILSVNDTLADSIGYLKASNTDTEDLFGGVISLSADGQTLAVGADNEDSNTTGIDGDENNNDATNSGAVYIFARNQNRWQQQAYLKASNTGFDDRFGRALSLSADGHTLAVGAAQERSKATGINGDQSDNNAKWSGAVYIFTRNENTWQQQTYLKASNTDADDTFGNSLSLSADGQSLAVGAPLESSAATGINGDQQDNEISGTGAVYIFDRDEDSWQQQAYIKANTTDSYDHFGISVSLSGDGRTLAAGASNESSSATGINGDENDDSASGSGAAYVFTRSGDSWQQQAYIKASNTDKGDGFGGALSLSADGLTLAVGARREKSSATGINSDESDNSLNASGAVYIFARTEDSWQQQAYIKASNTDEYDSFGNSMSLSADGQILAVEAPYENSRAIGIGGDQLDNSADNSGAVYIFVRSENNWQQKAYLKASNASRADLFGHSISLSADGQTLAVGARKEDSNATGIGGNQQDDSVLDSGAVYIY